MFSTDMHTRMSIDVECVNADAHSSYLLVFLCVIAMG